MFTNCIYFQSGGLSIILLHKIKTREKTSIWLKLYVEVEMESHGIFVEIWVASDLTMCWKCGKSYKILNEHSTKSDSANFKCTIKVSPIPFTLSDEAEL